MLILNLFIIIEQLTWLEVEGNEFAGHCPEDVTVQSCKGKISKFTENPTKISTIKTNSIVYTKT